MIITKKYLQKIILKEITNFSKIEQYKLVRIGAIEKPFVGSAPRIIEHLQLSPSHYLYDLYDYATNVLLRQEVSNKRVIAFLSKKHNLSIEHPEPLTGKPLLPLPPTGKERRSAPKISDKKKRVYAPRKDVIKGDMNCALCGNKLDKDTAIVCSRCKLLVCKNCANLCDCLGCIKCGGNCKNDMCDKCENICIECGCGTCDACTVHHKCYDEEDYNIDEFSKNYSRYVNYIDDDFYNPYGYGKHPPKKKNKKKNEPSNEPYNYENWQN